MILRDILSDQTSQVMVLTVLWYISELFPKSSGFRYEIFHFYKFPCSPSVSLTELITVWHFLWVGCKWSGWCREHLSVRFQKILMFLEQGLENVVEDGARAQDEANSPYFWNLGTGGRVVCSSVSHSHVLICKWGRWEIGTQNPSGSVTHSVLTLCWGCGGPLNRRRPGPYPPDIVQHGPLGGGFQHMNFSGT